MVHSLLLQGARLPVLEPATLCTTRAAAAWASPCCLWIVSVAGAGRDWGPIVLPRARRTLSSSCQGAPRGRWPQPHPRGDLAVTPLQGGFRAAALRFPHPNLWLLMAAPGSPHPSLREEARAGVETAGCSQGEGAAKGHGTEEEKIEPRQILAARLGREGGMNSRGRKVQQAPGGQGWELLSRAELSSFCSIVLPALRTSETGN